MRISAGLLIVVLWAGPAVAQANGGDPSLGTRIGSPEFGGGYRYDLGKRIGPADTSGRRPFELRDRIAPDEGVVRRPIIRAPQAGSSAAARRAARERYLRAQERRAKSEPAKLDNLSSTIPAPGSSLQPPSTIGTPLYHDR